MLPFFCLSIYLNICNNYALSLFKYLATLANYLAWKIGLESLGLFFKIIIINPFKLFLSILTGIIYFLTYLFLFFS